MKIETKKGLWVSSSFTEKFGNEDITPAKTVPEFKTLERNMYDSEIQKEFGVKECTLKDVAAFLKNPPKGCNDGYANLFYVSGCVVDVHWSGDGREWRVLAWELDYVHWNAGYRTFSRNLHSDSKTSELSSSDTLPSIHEDRFNSIEARITDLETIIKELK